MPYVPVACYALLVVAFVIDALTPQSFVVAILMNGPIALSSVVLQRSLTVRLVILAEIGNVAAGYINGVAAGNHWDAIALGNRTLLAASFLLVGYMSIQAQSLAVEAGRAALRAAQATNEKALRRAIERVRATLSPDLVQRAVVREAVELFGALRALMIVRTTLLDEPETIAYERGAVDVNVTREKLPVEAGSLVNVVNEGVPAQLVTMDNPTGRYLLERWGVNAILVASISARDGSPALSRTLFVVPEIDRTFSENDFDLFLGFSQQAAQALTQAALFARLAEQNEEIVAQRNEVTERNQVIRDIVYALAHDLRTPLSAASTTMNQALEGAYGSLPDGYREILSATVSSNDELRRLAETLLLVARYELGEASVVRAPVALAEIARAVVTELKPLAGERSVALLLTNGEGAAVDGDASQLRRALTNLVANALSATPAGGHVEIQIRAAAKDVEVAVRDDGYGVPLERRNGLFERFSGNASSSGGGTGLGLYLVRRVIEQHGGTVRYEPGEAKGSVFTIRLPAMVRA
ncbi:MAG: HAMP domain-containing histidine kinase [Candidatus Eremiobacteraeota bacterium]|nr:HAMP domain-containing histidine kinase [Candidatus Eremiobacteraeota bacterium]